MKTGTDMEQHLQISDLEVSTRDASGPYVPINFVSFDVSPEAALEIEATFAFWLFPTQIMDN